VRCLSGKISFSAGLEETSGRIVYEVTIVRHYRHEAYGFSRHRRHSHGMRGFNGNQGFGNYSGFAGGNQNQPNGQN
jgi:hypothetical protein